MRGQKLARRNLCLPVAVLAAMALTNGLCRAQTDYFPTHPDVEAMVRRGLNYLDTATLPQASGYKVLAALTIVEASKRYDAVVPVDHPLVEEAAKRIASELESGTLEKQKALYYPSLALILMCDLGDEKYKNEINQLIKILVDRQEPEGGFTYLKERGLRRGDTSQMQYVSLALWVAHRRGFSIPLDTPKKALQWLLETNMSNGSWYYTVQNGQPTSNRFDLSVHAAALAAVYLFSDYLGLNPKSSRRRVSTDQQVADDVAYGVALPPSVTVYVPPKDGDDSEIRTGGPLVTLNLGKLSFVKAEANRYLRDNFAIQVDHWPYFYLYALERYAFFREKAEGSVREIPDWYDQGVRLLIERQDEDGSFKSTQQENKFLATCCSILFLIRASEILILPGGEGDLSGSIGLKSNVRLDLVGGRVKSFDVIRGLDDVLQLLDSDDIDEEQFEMIQDSLTTAIGQLANDKNNSRRQQLAWMRGLVSDRNYFRRMIAIKLLARQQDMDNVPALIYALGDPDLRICAEAHNGLRLISRKLDSIRVSDNPDYAEYQNVKRQWTEWFLTIRPGAELLD